MSIALPDTKGTITGRLLGGPAGFRRQLEQLGPVFIKIGQYLALRPDIISQEYCDELMGLVDQVPPFPWQEAKRILTEDLGDEPTEIFASIDQKPVAAGSLAQTHVAYLKDGTKLALKIQRPNIRTMVLRDLGRARLMGRLLELSGASLIVSPQEIVEELTVWLMEEMDFVNELANVTRLYHLTTRSRIEKVPRPYPALSSPRVIATEYLSGVPVSELLLTFRSDRLNKAERVEALEIDINRLAENLITASLTQIFRYHFFHADAHPGNLMALPGNVIGFVDFGLCDELDERMRKRQISYLSAVYSRDPERIFKAITEILIPSEKTNIEAFRRDFLAEITAKKRKGRMNGQHIGGVPSNLERSPIAEEMTRVMRVARRHGLQIPPRVLSMYRTLFTVETVAHHLGTEVSLMSVGQEFFTTLQTEEALRALKLNNIQASVISSLALLSDSPHQLQQILTDLADGRSSLSVYTSESPKVRCDHNQRTRLVVAAILSVGIALLLTKPELSEQLGLPLEWPLSGALILLYLWILIQWWRL